MINRQDREWIAFHVNPTMHALSHRYTRRSSASSWGSSIPVSDH